MYYIPLLNLILKFEEKRRNTTIKDIGNAKVFINCVFFYLTSKVMTLGLLFVSDCEVIHVCENKTYRIIINTKRIVNRQSEDR